MATFAYTRINSTEAEPEKIINELVPFVNGQNEVLFDITTGTDFDQSEYKALIGSESVPARLQQGDLLVIRTLADLGRVYADMRREWQRLKDMGVFVKVLDIGLIDTRIVDGYPVGDLIANLVLALLTFIEVREYAHYKRTQKEGIAKAIAKGVKVGKPPIPKPRHWGSVIARMNAGEITATKAIEILGMKRTTFYKMLSNAKN